MKAHTENFKAALVFFSIAVAFALYATTWIGFEPTNAVEAFQNRYGLGLAVVGAIINAVSASAFALTGFFQKHNS